MEQPDTTTEEPRDQKVELQDGTVVNYSKTEVLTQLWSTIDEASMKRGKIDPLKCMSALKAYISFDRPLPKGLKAWFLNGLELHAELNGKTTLDAIFGFTGKERQPNAYTRAQAETPRLLGIVDYLVCIVVDLKPTPAARLAVWLTKSRIDPENVAREWREVQKSTPVIPASLFEEANCRENALDILAMFTSQEDSLGKGGVEKDLTKLHAAIEVIKEKSASECFQLFCGLKKLY